MKKFDLKVGYACNNDCVHCVVASKRKVKNVTFQEIIDSIPLDVSEIVVTGGEPTVRKDFLKILAAIRKKLPNVYITLQTNGRKLKSKEFARETGKYVSFVLIALHSSDENVHDAITQRQGSWRETIQGFKNAKKFIKKVSSQTVISRLNYKTLPETYDFIYHNLGIESSNLTFPHPNGNAFTMFDKVVPTYSEIKFYIDQVIVKHKNRLMLEAIPPCYIHPLMDDVYLYRYFYDVGGFDKANEESIIEDYRHLILGEHRKADSCNRCMYKKECIGVWKEYFMHSLVDLPPINSPIRWPICTIIDNEKQFRILMKNIPSSFISNLIVFFSNDKMTAILKQTSDELFFKAIHIENEKNLLPAALQFKRSFLIRYDLPAEGYKLLSRVNLNHKTLALHPSKLAIAQYGFSLSEIEENIDVHRFLPINDNK